MIKEILNKIEEIETTCIENKWSYNTMWYVLKAQLLLLQKAEDKKNGISKTKNEGLLNGNKP